MKIKLVVVEGKTNKSQLAMSLPATIGRSRDASLTISHPMISRHHCELYENEGYAWVRDNGSTNGTIVDGKAVTESILMPQTLLRVGPLTFQVDYTPSVEVAPTTGVLPALIDIQVPADPGVADTPYAGAIEQSPQFEAIPEALPAESDSPQPPVQIDVAGNQYPPGMPTIEPAGGGNVELPGLTAIGSSHPPVDPAAIPEPPQFGPPPPSPQVDSSLYDQPVGTGDFASYADSQEEPDPIEGVAGYDAAESYPQQVEYDNYVPAPPGSSEEMLDDLEVVDEAHHFKIEEEEVEPTPPPPIPPHLRGEEE